MQKRSHYIVTDASSKQTTELLAELERREKISDAYKEIQKISSDQSWTLTSEKEKTLLLNDLDSWFEPFEKEPGEKSILFELFLEEYSKNPISKLDELLDLVQKNHNQWHKMKAITVWTKELSGMQAPTAFHCLFQALYKNPQSDSLLQFLQTIFQKIGYQPVWVIPFENGNLQGTTPFYWLVCLIPKNPPQQSLMLTQLLIAVHHQLGKKRDEHWLTKTRDGFSPFFRLIEGIIDYEDDRRIRKIIWDINEDFSLSVNEIWTQSFTKNNSRVTLFLVLLKAFTFTCQLPNDATSQFLCRLITKIHAQMGESKKQVWLQSTTFSNGKNLTPFRLLLFVLFDKPNLKRLLQLVKDVHLSLEEDVRPIWLRNESEKKNVYVVTTNDDIPLNKLKRILLKADNIIVPELFEFIRDVYNILGDPQERWIEPIEDTQNRWTTFDRLLLSLEKNPTSDKLVNLIAELLPLYKDHPDQWWLQSIYNEKSSFEILFDTFVHNSSFNSLIELTTKVIDLLTSQLTDFWLKDWSYGITPFYNLVGLLSNNSTSSALLKMVQTVHESLGNDAQSAWLKETGDNKGTTPFYWLLVALSNNSTSTDLLKMVETVHGSLGNDAKKSAWLTERKAGDNKGATPLYFLSLALSENSTSTQLFEMVQTVHESLGNDAQSAWLKETGDNKGTTPFYGLLGALNNNSTSTQLLEMVQTVHKCLGDQAKTAWLKERKAGDEKGATPFYWLLGALSKNSTSTQLFEMVQTVHKSLGDDAKSAWLKERKAGDEKGITPFYGLLCALRENSTPTQLFEMVQTVHESLGDDAKKSAWLTEGKAGDFKGVTPFYWLLSALIKNNTSTQLLEMSETVTQLLEMVETVHKSLGDDAKSAWLKKRKTGGSMKGATPFYLLVVAFSLVNNNNSEFTKLLEMIETVRKSLGDDAKSAWLTEKKAGDDKGATPFYWLLSALNNNSQSTTDLLEMIETVHKSLGGDAKSAWLIEGEAGNTQFYQLVASIGFSTTPEKIYPLIKMVHESFENPSRELWLKTSQNGQEKGSSALSVLYECIEKNPQSETCIQLLEMLINSSDVVYQQLLFNELILVHTKLQSNQEKDLTRLKGIIKRLIHKNNGILFCGLVVYLRSEHQDSVSKSLETIHELLEDKGAWLKPTEGEQAGWTPFMQLLCSFELYPTSERIYQLIKNAHDSVENPVLDAWMPSIQTTSFTSNAFSYLLKILKKYPHSKPCHDLLDLVVHSCKDVSDLSQILLTLIVVQELDPNDLWVRLIVNLVLDVDNHVLPYVVTSFHEEKDVLSSVHGILGNQAKTAWLSKIQNGEYKEWTPFLLLLTTLARNPETAHLWEALQKVRDCFGDQQIEKSAWLTAIEVEENKKITPFNQLIIACAFSPKTEQWIDLLKSVHISLGQDAKHAWLRKIPSTVDAKILIPFHMFLAGLGGNPRCSKLWEMLTQLHLSFEEKAKDAWLKKLHIGSHESTSFSSLLEILAEKTKEKGLIGRVKGLVGRVSYRPQAEDLHILISVSTELGCPDVDYWKGSDEKQVKQILMFLSTVIKRKKLINFSFNLLDTLFVSIEKTEGRGWNRGTRKTLEGLQKNIQKLRQKPDYKKWRTERNEVIHSFYVLLWMDFPREILKKISLFAARKEHYFCTMELIQQSDSQACPR